MTMTDLIPWRRRKNNMAVRRERDLDDWMGSFHREMNHLTNCFFHGFDLEPWGWTDGFAGGDSSLRVNISETDKAIKVTAELPGMDEKDIDITLSGDSLTIKGEKKEKCRTEWRVTKASLPPCIAVEGVVPSTRYSRNLRPGA